MEKKEILEQLNREIENEQLPTTPLYNVLREMRKKKEKKPTILSKLSKRNLRRIVAICSALIVVAVISPLVFNSFVLLNDKSVSTTGEGYSPQHTQPVPCPSIVTKSENDSYGKNVKYSWAEEQSVENISDVKEFEGEEQTIKYSYNNEKYLPTIYYGDKVTIKINTDKKVYVGNKLNINEKIKGVKVFGSTNKSGKIVVEVVENQIVIQYKNIDNYDNLMALIEKIN